MICRKHGENSIKKTNKHELDNKEFHIRGREKKRI